MERHPLIALLTLTGIVLAGIACRCSNAAASAGVRPPTPGSSAGTGTSATWPKEVQEVSISSTADGIRQPALFWEPAGQEERPLLVAWHAKTKARHLYYTQQIEASCGGPPGTSPAVDFQYWNRSPLHFLARASGVPLDLNAGIRDGHDGSVPLSHSLHAFNVLAPPSDRLSESIIAELVQNAQVPEALRSQDHDSAYGANTVLFRRESGSVRITLFDGGHEILHDAALARLERQSRPPEGTGVFLFLTGKRTNAVSTYDNSLEGVSTICEQGPEVTGSALVQWSNHTAP